MNRFENEPRPRFVMGESSFGKMLMLEADHDYIYRLGRFWAPEGYCDWDLAAKAGVRIFVFADKDAIERVPARGDFICGTWEDLAAIMGSGKVHVDNRGNAILNPLQNVWEDMLNLEDTPTLAIAKVSLEEFRSAFGPKRFTTIFPKEV